LIKYPARLQAIRQREKGMNKRINFEDNIFVLTTLTRMLKDLLTLDTDPELFLEKTLNDMEFVDKNLDLFLGCLVENQRLIEREELLSHLSVLEWQYSQVLSQYLEGGGNVSAGEFPVTGERVQAFRARSRERQKRLEAAGKAGRISGENSREDPLVSSDELSALLGEFDP
jgi:hypothetical protein